MLSLRGVDGNEYSERVGRGKAIPEMCCPDPQCQKARLGGHGWYERFLGGVVVEIRRLRCARCGVTHALLPEGLCAYRDATLDGLEVALESDGPTSGARAAEQRGTGAVRRVRSWLRAMRSSWASKILALLPAATGSWIERVRSAFGPSPGALVRLRQWLWTRYGYFFAGPAGLFRLGRPGMPVR